MPFVAACGCGRHLAPAGVAALLLAPAPARALTISTTFDASITDNANATAIETAIDGAIGFYSGFTDPVNVSIDYQLAPSSAGYLGASLSDVNYQSYAAYTGALQADATANANTVEATGYAHLATGNTASQIQTSTADARALGFTAPGTLGANGGFGGGSFGGGSFDGVIYLNAADLAGFGGGGPYDPTRVIQHETNEVLGIGGTGSVLNTMQQSNTTTPPNNGQGTYIGPLNLFRYASPGGASLTTSGSASSYFSIDGGASSIVAFNQDSGGDYADWGAPGCTALVQQAFSCTNPASLSLTSPEVTALQAIGYDLPVPEPAALSLFGVGVIALGVSRFRRSPN